MGEILREVHYLKTDSKRVFGFTTHLKGSVTDFGQKIQLKKL